MSRTDLKGVSLALDLLKEPPVKGEGERCPARTNRGLSLTEHPPLLYVSVRVWYSTLDLCTAAQRERTVLEKRLTCSRVGSRRGAATDSADLCSSLKIRTL